MRSLVVAVLLVLASAPAAHAVTPHEAFGVAKARADLPALDGDGLVVAVIDTAVDDQHPVLAEKVVDTVDLAPPEPPGCYAGGHGTWVSGIIAGTAAGGLPEGVAPDARILSVEVVDKCANSSLARIAEGIDWVVEHRAQYGVDLINLSVGDPQPGGAETDAAEAAVERAVLAGIPVVAAAGNRGGLGMVASPASAEAAISVGAMTDPSAVPDLGGPGFRPLWFSASGPTADGRIKPDLLGAGVQNSAWPGDADGFATAGTSGAAAFVSGVALLMLDADPGLTPAELKAALVATAQDWGRAGKDEDFGAGRLDAYAALQAVGAPLSAPPPVPAHRSVPGRAPASHEIAVEAGTPLVVTVTPDPADRLPAGPAPDLQLHLDGPGVDLTAPPDGRWRSVGVAAPVAGTYTATVTGNGVYELDVSGALAPASPALALTLDVPKATTNDPTPRLSGTAAGGVAVRVYRNGLQVRSLWAVPAPDGTWSTEPAVDLPDGAYEVAAEHGLARTARRSFTVDSTAAEDDPGPGTAPATGGGGTALGDWPGGSAPGGVAASPLPDAAAPHLAFAGAVPRALKTLRGSGLALLLRCDEPCTIRGKLLAGRGHGLPRRLAQGSASLEAAGTAKLRLRASAAIRKRLRRVRSFRLTIVVVATDAAGNEYRLRKTLTLR